MFYIPYPKAFQYTLNMDNRKWFEMASSFRKAIEDAIDSGNLHEVNLLGFSVGCCTYASDLLQRYLFENGIVTIQMSGEYGNGRTGESHAWLETLDGIVIDIKQVISIKTSL